MREKGKERRKEDKGGKISQTKEFYKKRDS